MVMWKIGKNNRLKNIISFFIINSIILIVLTNIFDFHIEYSSSMGAVIIVEPDGSEDYRTIQNAIDNASSGDTIQVNPGTYYENVTINKTVTLTGAGSENTIIFGIWSEAIIEVKSNWSNISGLTISGIGSYSVLSIKGNFNSILNCDLIGNVIGISLLGANYNIIKNCTCQNNSGAGLVFGSADHNTIVNTSCINSTYGPGISLFNSYKNTFQDGNCDGNSEDGIYAYWLSNGNIVINYTCNNNQGNGIYLFDSDYFIIDNCTCKNNDGNGFIIGSIKNKITNCTSISNGGDGFFLYHSESSEISNTFSCKNSGIGIYLKYSNKNLITNNSIISNLGLGVKLDSNSADNNIYLNDIINNLVGKPQVLDNGTDNAWNSGEVGNFWWDYLYYNHNASNDGNVWDTPFDVPESRNVTDNYPLTKFRLGLDKINQIHPGVLNDNDLDGVYDLLDAFPDDPLKWKSKQDPTKIFLPLLLGPFVDEAGAFVENAIVTIDINGIYYSNLTNSSGLVTIHLPQITLDGEYNLTVSKEGYEDLKLEISFENNNFKLPVDMPKLKKINKDNEPGFISGFEIFILIIALCIFLLLIFIRKKSNNF